MMAGELRHKIEIQEADSIRDDMGQEIATWQSVGDRWCSIKPLAGLENFYGESIKAGVTHEIKMRFYEGLSPKMRLRHHQSKGLRLFQIKSVKNVMERNRMTICMCTENVS